MRRSTRFCGEPPADLGATEQVEPAVSATWACESVRVLGQNGWPALLGGASETGVVFVLPGEAETATEPVVATDTTRKGTPVPAPTH